MFVKAFRLFWTATSIWVLVLLYFFGYAFLLSALYRWPLAGNPGGVIGTANVLIYMAAILIASRQIGSQPWACAARWMGFSVFLGLAALSLYFACGEFQDITVTPQPNMFFIFLPALIAFFGGDLGDRKRIRREREEQRAQEEAIERDAQRQL